MPFIKNQISRQLLKRTATSGLIPQVGPTLDHTDGLWTNTDIYGGEFYWNMADQALWLGWATGTTSGVTLIFSGGTGGGGTYTADNGLTENPANNFQLGGTLLQDTTIDGNSSAYSFNFTNLYASTYDTQQKTLFSVFDGTQTQKMWLYPQNGQLLISYDEGGGIIQEFQFAGGKFYLPAANFASASNGDVLTLMDNTTGRVEYQPAGSASINADNGLTESPSNNIQLGGTLLQDTTINGATNTYNLDFSALKEHNIYTNEKIRLESINGIYDCRLKMDPLNQNSQWFFSDGTNSSKVELTPSIGAFQATNEMRIQTPNYLTATNGDVLTLIDNTSGEVEYQPLPGLGPTNCITDLYVTNFHGCSPMNMKDPVICESGLTSTTISATTYYNLPPITFTGGSVTGATQFTGGLTANTISATTYQNLPITQGITGITANSGLSANTTNNVTTIINTQVQGITGITTGTGISATTSNNVVNLSAVGNIGNYFRKTNAISSANVTGGVAEVKIYSMLIPANTITAGSVIYINGRYSKGATANGVCTARWYFNTSDTIGGTQVMARQAGATNAEMTHERRLSVNTLTTTRYFGPLTSTTSDTDTTSNNGQMIAGTIDWTLDQYLIFTIQPAGASDVFNGRHLKIEVDLYNP